MPEDDIDHMIPSAGRADTDALRAHDAEELAQYVADPTHPWWRRRACAQALAGRVPEPWADALLDRVRDIEDVGEVRRALLEIVGDRPELLPWLRHEDRGRETSYGMPDAFLRTRGLAGDLTAAEDLAVLAASPWRRTQEAGETGLDALVAHHGLQKVLTRFGEDRPEDRLFRLRMRYRAGQDVTYALADPDRTVAHLAHTLAHDADALRAFLTHAPTTESALWAVLALHELTEVTKDTEDTEARAETRRLYKALGSPRVEVPGLDEELRVPILHEYAQRSQRLTDPRWRVEVLCAEPPAPHDVDAWLSRATHALTSAGLAPSPPVDCGAYHQQGGGTYHVIKFGDSAVRISTLGPYASAAESGMAARPPLEAAGFRWLDEDTAATKVTDLCVYYFGDREALAIETLLFYWQD
ncbi:hypothetical protein ABZO31_00710 [Streptomyces sp. HUAS MG47]|uniref:hypothetical protein n=1 Tax=Streptomyces solicamelliae TaxID=3231716 RepID=UPI003877B1F3